MTKTLKSKLNSPKSNPSAFIPSTALRTVSPSTALRTVSPSTALRVRNYERSRIGFTIVELLVVIVVIAILAAITIVSYTGITQRSIVASMQSDLDNASRQLKMFESDNGSFPATISTNCVSNPDTTTNKCLKVSNGITLTYTSTPTSDYKYKLVATKDTTSLYITNLSSYATGGKNLLTGDDTSFEGSGKGGWAGEARCTSANVSGGWHGTKQLNVTATDVTWNKVSNTVTTITTAGSQYTASAWVRAENTDAVGKKASLQFYSNTTPNWAMGTEITLTTSWQRVTAIGVFNTDSTARSLILSMGYTGGTVVGAITVWDAIQLETGSAPTSY